MKRSEIKKIIKEEISKIMNSNRYEIIDPQQTDQSLNTILDAISLLNKSGLEITPIDRTGHYSGGYGEVNSVYITSPIPYNELIRQANSVLFKNDMEHLRIIEAPLSN